MAQDAAQTWARDAAGPPAGGVLPYGRGPSAMNDDIESQPGSPVVDLAEYVQVLWKYRLIVAGVFAAVLAIGATYTLLLTPSYRASPSYSCWA
jgi:hypothetical protein